MPNPAHLFSVDVEEHFQVSAFDRTLSREEWERQPSRVERNTEVLLELLARHDAHATFFTLGWVAERQPALLRRIVVSGHEVASHGWWHRRLTSLTREEFREEARRSKAVLETLTGREVKGFRAPSFSIVPGGEWAFDVLLEEGYSYDSSLFPIRRPDYGYPAAPPVPHQISRAGGTLLEIPLATLEMLGLRFPAAGGGYLRQLPLGLVQRSFRAMGERGVPGMFYIHPWEVDPEQPRLPVGPLTRLRHYGGLERTLPRLERLLNEFRFTSVERWLGSRGAEGQRDRGAGEAGVAD
ncbi:MAG TPA: XrtA system polysaccharide deacetylase [Gemmatimonadales bacterium]|jgi:polysaccharide deacetylase family protein (PEP-CTERM system associated)|nr:XrtA system polysaccharide deacetylase [Gemmatimonadales bacterium]